MNQPQWAALQLKTKQTAAEYAQKLPNRADSTKDWGGIDDVQVLAHFLDATGFAGKVFTYMVLYPNGKSITMVEPPDCWLRINVESDMVGDKDIVLCCGRGFTHWQNTVTTGEARVPHIAPAPQQSAKTVDLLKD